VTAFRMIPYPLEKGHLFYPYPACTENADRELLPGMRSVNLVSKLWIYCAHSHNIRNALRLWNDRYCVVWCVKLC